MPWWHGHQTADMPKSHYFRVSLTHLVADLLSHSSRLHISEFGISADWYEIENDLDNDKTDIFYVMDQHLKFSLLKIIEIQ